MYFPLKDSLRVVFYFSIGQNYNPESAILLLRLQAILGVGNIKIELNHTGRPHIKYVVYNTQEILEKIVPYFLFLYGQKRFDLGKLHRIYDLSNTLSKTFDANLALELIHLVSLLRCSDVSRHRRRNCSSRRLRAVVFVGIERVSPDRSGRKEPAVQHLIVL